MTGCWLSVIVPTYNGARYLPDTLASVVTEGDDGVEVVVVDDGSTDDTLAVVDRFSDRLALRVEQRRVGNWVANTNLGLERARGTYACMLHQDDLWLPGRLAAVRQLLRRSPDAGLWLHDTEFIDAAGRPVGPWTVPLRSLPRDNSPAESVGRLLVQNTVAIPAPVFRRSDVLDTGGLDETLWYTADWDLWLRLAGQGGVARLAARRAGFRVHGESLTVTGSRRLDDYRHQMEQVLNRHLAVWTEPSARERRRVEGWARASLASNLLLAAGAAGAGVPVGPWLRSMGAVRPWDLGRWTYRSGLRERVASRLRAGLLRR